MRPLQEVSIATQFGLKRIGMYACNIADFDEPINILAASAYVGHYAKTHGTMMHALGEQGVNVKALSRHPAIDLRDLLGVWLSDPVKPKTGFEVERIACLELLKPSSDGDWRMTQTEVIKKVRALFQILDLASTAGIDVSCVALPMLGTGHQQIPIELVLPPIITECQSFLKRNPSSKRIVLFTRNPRKASQVASVLENSYVLQRVSKAGQQQASMKDGLLAFISYASEDVDVVQSLVQKIESKGVPAWYAPRDIAFGDFASAIVDAISRCSHFIVIISKNSIRSEHVLNEVSLAFEELGRNMLIMPLRIDSEEMTPSFQYYLKRQQWTEAGNPPSETRLFEFSDCVAKSAGNK